MQASIHQLEGQLLRLADQITARAGTPELEQHIASKLPELSPYGEQTPAPLAILPLIGASIPTTTGENENAGENSREALRIAASFYRAMGTSKPRAQSLAQLLQLGAGLLHEELEGGQVRAETISNFEPLSGKDQTGAGSQLATMPAEIRAFEFAQLNAQYRSAPPALRSLAWNLLQTALSPQTRPALLAFALALDLLETEDARAYHAAQGDGETFPDQEGVIAGFWSGKMGNMEAPELATETPESERGPITGAARALFILGQLAEQEGK